VYPLYSALEKYAVAWAADSEIVRYFSQETRDNVVLKIRRRWRGDPCTTPCASELPDDWEELLRAVLKLFCKDADEMNQVVETVMALVVNRQTVRGLKILEKQAANQPPASIEFGSDLERFIYKQKRQLNSTLA
jgi:hypothetical protein